MMSNDVIWPSILDFTIFLKSQEIQSTPNNSSLQGKYGKRFELAGGFN